MVLQTHINCLHSISTVLLTHSTPLRPISHPRLPPILKFRSADYTAGCFEFLCLQFPLLHFIIRRSIADANGDVISSYQRLQIMTENYPIMTTLSRFWLPTVRSARLPFDSWKAVAAKNHSPHLLYDIQTILKTFVQAEVTTTSSECLCCFEEVGAKRFTECGDGHVLCSQCHKTNLLNMISGFASIEDLSSVLCFAVSGGDVCCQRIRCSNIEPLVGEEVMTKWTRHMLKLYFVKRQIEVFECFHCDYFEVGRKRKVPSVLDYVEEWIWTVTDTLRPLPHFVFTNKSFCISLVTFSFCLTPLVTTLVSLTLFFYFNISPHSLLPFPAHSLLPFPLNRPSPAPTHFRFTHSHFLVHFQVSTCKVVTWHFVDVLLVLMKHVFAATASSCHSINVLWMKWTKHCVCM